MNNPWPVYRKLSAIAVLVTAIGFCGLWSCKTIRVAQHLSEREFIATTPGAIATWFFSFCFIFGLLVLNPAALYLIKRNRPELLGPNVPNWLAWPFVIVLIAIGAVFVLGLTGLFLTHILHR